MAMVCETCGGTRFCGPCDGRGAFTDLESGEAFECKVCSGYGACPDCDGEGEIEDYPDLAEFEVEGMEMSE